MVYLSVNGHADAMPPDLHALIDDLRDEQAELRDLLQPLSADAWDAPTPSPGWTVLHQVRHLAHGEVLGRLAATDPDAFAAELTRMLDDLAGLEAATTAPNDVDPPASAMRRWWREAEALRTAMASGPPSGPIDWITGPMSRASFLTARLMETFAHGHDIATAVGVERPATDRLRHVAHLGVATRGFAFTNLGLAPPEGAARVELEAPGGGRWTWGPDDAPDVVRGPALDFCLLVTKRRHRDDTALEAGGPNAERWLGIAQCFAGAPTDGPAPSPV